MEWPSERVKPGGIFQPARVSYSPETKNFLKVLLGESKLSMMQRKKVDYSLRSGEPLPVFDKKSPSNTLELSTEILRPGTSRRRSRSTIIQSGAYDREKFRSRFPKTDREKAKKHLQNVMTYGKEHPESPRKQSPPKKQNEELPENRFDQLVREIEDRKKWLKEMESLGEGKKYESMIELQVQERIREMKNLKLKR